MNNVFLHKAFAPDDRIGHVDEQGRVFETRFGPDKIVGRVDLRSGKIYESRSGKDEYLGKIDPTTGKIYLEKLGPDEYLGKVNQHGECYLHKRFARDDYLGKITDLQSPIHAAAAFLLLIIPAFEQTSGKKILESSSSPANKGTKEN